MQQLFELIAYLMKHCQTSSMQDFLSAYYCYKLNLRAYIYKKKHMKFDANE